jgi:hypothetical protein
MLSEVSQVQKDIGYVFSLICGRQIQIQIQALSYICIYMCIYMCVCVYIYIYIYIYIRNIFPKVGLLEDTKGGEKEENNDRE